MSGGTSGPLGQNGHTSKNGFVCGLGASCWQGCDPTLEIAVQLFDHHFNPMVGSPDKIVLQASGNVFRAPDHGFERS
jgi:hypothetical protein